MFLDLQISDIPSNIWQGTQCWLLGQNFITRDNGYDCSVALNCGTGISLSKQRTFCALTDLLQLQTTHLYLDLPYPFLAMVLIPFAGGRAQCCDSCDGSIPSISSLPALWGVCLYMVANIAYNVFLVLVIKHGSAALMYATSTVVLPLGMSPVPCFCPYLSQKLQSPLVP